MAWGSLSTSSPVEQFIAHWFRHLRQQPALAQLPCPHRQKPHHIRRAHQLAKHYVVGAVAKVALGQLAAQHLQAVYRRMVVDGVPLVEVQSLHALLHQALCQAQRVKLVRGVATDRVAMPHDRHGAVMPSSRPIVLSQTKQVDLLPTGMAGADRPFTPRIANVALPTIRLCQETHGVSWFCTGCGIHFHGKGARQRLGQHLAEVHYPMCAPPPPSVPLIAAPSPGMGPGPVRSSLDPGRYCLRASADH